MRSFSRPPFDSPEYTFIGGGPQAYWPQPQYQEPRRKKKIIIVQNGMPVSETKKKKRHSKYTSDSDSDISIVVKDATPRNRRNARRSESESSEDSDSGSRSREKKQQRKSKSVTILKNQKTVSKTKQKKKKTESDSDGKEKKNIRFDLKNVNNRRFSKSKAVQVKQDSTPEPDSVMGTPEPDLEVPKIEATEQSMPKIDIQPIKEERVDVQAGTNPAKKPASTESSPAPARSPLRPKNSTFSPRPNNNRNGINPTATDDADLLAALDQLDKRSDFELEQLKGGNLRKLPPDVNLEMKKKIFSTEFQRSIDSFLES